MHGLKQVLRQEKACLWVPLYLSFLLFLLLVNCGDPKTSPSNTAQAEEEAVPTDPRRPRHDLVADLRADVAAERHPSDGGGRAWLEDGEEAIFAGRPGRFSIVYETGPEGIADGGMVYLQVSPFWGWSTPQTEAPGRVGYTEASTDADGVSLEATTFDAQLLGIAVSGRALVAGERLRIVYGAGSAGALADRFAERQSRFWIAVDGDGDGVRKVLADSPGVDVLPGPAVRMLAHLPSTARPDQPTRLTLAAVDGVGNGWTDFTGDVQLSAPDAASWRLPSTVRFEPTDKGTKVVDLTAPEGGVVRILAEAEGLAPAESNPMQVSSRGGRILWADLQCHSSYSDGTALPVDLVRYARDVAALDVVSLTDHDHWGMLFLDQNPELWDEIRRVDRDFHEPGRFVTIPGFEWTHWAHGHRHVLFFDEGEDAGAELFSSIDPRWDHPEKLWNALRGRRALTIAHHSAGGPIATDWSIPPDPELEPVTEIVSVHGSSEAADSPALIYRAVPGNFVRDALARGYRLGFLGSSDGHDGHPGLAQLAGPTGGLAAILAEDLTRDGIYEALRARRVYATSGARIILRLSYGGYRMGENVPLVELEEGRVAAPDGPVPGIPRDSLVVQILGTAVIERVDVVRSGRVQGVLCDEGARECSFALRIQDLEAGEYLYIRVVQTDGGLAWSSPFYFDAAEEDVEDDTEDAGNA